MYDRMGLLNYLSKKYPKYAEFWYIADIVLRANETDGMVYLTPEEAEEIELCDMVPILGPEIVEINVTPEMLTWQVQTMENEPEIWSITAFLRKVIDANLMWSKIELAISDLDRKNLTLAWCKVIEELEAGIIKTAATILANKTKIVGLRAKHMTMENVKSIHAPEKYLELLNDKNVLRHIIVVKNKRGFTANDPIEAQKFLKQLGFNIIVQKASVQQIESMIKEAGTIVSMLVRHPIIGYVAFGTTKIADIMGIGVEASIAEKLDGDDDGDFVELVPLAYFIDPIDEFVKVRGE